MAGERERPLRKLLLCISGGFQAYAAPGFVLSVLRHLADDVQVVLSRAASRMVSGYALEVASRHPVFVEMDDSADGVYVPHIELSRDVDALLVYPATVNLLGKIANGIADELIAATVLAASCPVFFVPVTNEQMWNHPAVQRNVSRLTADGYTVLPPLPTVEVATREGLQETADPFPLPTLLVQMSAAVRHRSPAGSAKVPRP